MWGANCNIKKMFRSGFQMLRSHIHILNSQPPGPPHTKPSRPPSPITTLMAHSSRPHPTHHSPHGLTSQPSNPTSLSPLATASIVSSPHAVASCRRHCLGLSLSLSHTHTHTQKSQFLISLFALSREMKDGDRRWSCSYQ